MGIAHVKEQLRDIPGVEGLTMQMQGGQCVYSVNGHTITLDSSTSDKAAADAIRAILIDSAATAAQPASTVPMTDTPAPAPVAPTPTAAVLPPVTPVAAPAPAPAAVLPAVAAAPAPAPVAPPAASGTTTPGAHALTIKSALDAHGKKLDQILQASLVALQSVLDDQVNTVAGGTQTVIANVKSHTDQFKAILGQFSNEF